MCLHMHAPHARAHGHGHCPPVAGGCECFVGWRGAHCQTLDPTAEEMDAVPGTDESMGDEDSEEAPQELYAHKFVLGLSSPVFMTMFSGFGSESVTNASHSERGRSIVRPPFSFSAVESMLNYMYRGATTLDEPLAFASNETIGLACELLHLSDCYELRHLKQLIEARLESWDIITVENVVSLTTHAAAANASQLLDVCIHCLRHLHDVVRETPEWADLPPYVVEEVELPAGEARRLRATRAARVEKGGS